MANCCRRGHFAPNDSHHTAAISKIKKNHITIYLILICFEFHHAFPLPASIFVEIHDFWRLTATRD